MGLSNDPPTSGELTAIRWEITDRVATVWLHRPHRHNAWTGTMHTEFRQVMADLEHRDDVRAVVVTGTPPAFCVGGDSKALADHGERGGYDSGLAAEPATPGGGDRLDADMAWQLGYRLPIIAAVNGACAGVGLSLVLFCDLRFVAPPPSSRPRRRSSVCRRSTARAGCCPASSASPGRTTCCCRAESSPARRLPTGACGTASSPTARPRSPQPRRYGRLLAESAGTNAVTMTKRQIADDLLRHDPAASVADSLRLLDQAMGTAEYREGVSALTEKRPPNF